MTPSRASRRYAAAIFGLARDLHCAEDLMDASAALARLVDESPALAVFLGNYTLSRRTRSETLTRLFRERLPPVAWRLIAFLESKRRLGLLQDVCVVLRELREKEAGIRKVTLTTAFPLGEDGVRLISERMARKAGGRIDLTVAVRPALLAGFSFQVGDQLCDLSTAGALRALREKLTGG